MKKLLVALLFLSACAQPPGVLAPWFDNPVLDPEFVVLDYPLAGVEVNCQYWGNFVIKEGWTIHGCVIQIGPFRPGEACVIFMNRDLPYAQYVKTLRHEKAHCRGWRHGQPQPEGS